MTTFHYILSLVWLFNMTNSWGNGNKHLGSSHLHQHQGHILNQCKGVVLIYPHYKTNDVVDWVCATTVAKQDTMSPNAQISRQSPLSKDLGSRLSLDNSSSLFPKLLYLSNAIFSFLFCFLSIKRLLGWRFSHFPQNRNQTIGNTYFRLC